MSRYKNKSLKLNMVLNAIKGIMTVIFPLITFPYVSRVLEADNLGKYNFANSIISYLILFAGLGIETYAIRESAGFCENEKRFNDFACDMFSINMFSTILSYLCFFVLMIIVPKFHEYQSILVILSLQIMFKTIGIEWLYSIFEDYVYITLRSAFFQVVSLVMLFLLVKTKRDLFVYSIITVVSSGGASLLNFIHAKKYCSISIRLNANWKNYIKPILVLFAISATVTIYVSSDITMLGFLCDDKTVGIYSVSTKIYTILKTILSSVIVVSIPRLSSFLGKNDKDRFNAIADDIYKTLITFVLPVITIIIVLRKKIVLILAGNEYYAAESSLILLGIALFFCLGAWFWGQCILVVVKKETIIFKITIISALLNICLNFILIPFWKENAAALTTIMAESISFVWCRAVGKKYVNFSGIGKHYYKVFIGCIGIICTGYVIKSIKVSGYFEIVLTTIIAVIFYIIIEIVLKNGSVISALIEYKNKTRFR